MPKDASRVMNVWGKSLIYYGKLELFYEETCEMFGSESEQAKGLHDLIEKEFLALKKIVPAVFKNR